MFINFGEIITKNDLDLNEPDGKRYQSFNNRLEDQLRRAVLEIDKNDLPKQKQLLEKKPTVFEKIILFIPAVTGWLLHAPLYWPIKAFTYQKTRYNDHYDAVLVVLLLCTYPFYIFLITFIVFTFTHNWISLFSLVIIPFTAWAYAQLKPQLDKSV